MATSSMRSMRVRYCQAYCSLKNMPNAKELSLNWSCPREHLLNASGKPWVIENVMGCYAAEKPSHALRNNVRIGFGKC